MPFLGNLFTPELDSTLLAMFYKKTTYIDKYLLWCSHHIPSAKYSMFNTPAYRAATFCSNPHLPQKEEECIREAIKDAIIKTRFSMSLQLKTVPVLTTAPMATEHM